jgi:hypothetical protein
MAMTGYVVVDDKLWQDEKFLRLSADAKLIFIWAWMPPHSAVSGLWYCEMEEICQVLDHRGTAANGVLVRAYSALAELAEKRMVLYDDDNHVMYVVNRVKYASKSPASLKLMRNEVKQVPESPLVDLFLAEHGPTLRLTRASKAHT